MVRIVPARVSNVRRPEVSGTLSFGSELTADDGLWEGNPTLSRQWYRDGAAISGEQATTHTVVDADLGFPLTVEVTARPRRSVGTRQTGVRIVQGQVAFESEAVTAPWTLDRLGAALLADWNADDLADGAVTTWTDAASSLAPTQGTADARPVKAADSFNGRAGVTFDGTDDELTLSSVTTIPTGSTAGEIWALVSFNSSANVEQVISYGGTGSATNRQLRKGASNLINGSDGAATATGPSCVGPHIVGLSFKGTALNGWMDGTAFSGNPTTIATLNTGTTRLRIGANVGTTAGQFLGGVIRRIIVTAELTTDQRQRVEGFLALEGGIQTNLPVDHPYRGTDVTDPEELFEALPAYFTPADSTTVGNAGKRLFMNAAPPPSDAADETTYALWPLTEAATQRMDLLAASTWSGGKWGFLWANRRTTEDSHNRRPNPLGYPVIEHSNGKQCRIEYSSIAKANAATLVRAMHWLAYTSAQYEAVATAAGFATSDIKTRATLSGDPDTYFTGSSGFQDGVFQVATDIIMIDDNDLTDGSSYEGIVIDYECQDSRSDAETTAFVTSLATVVHDKSKELVFYTNPLDGAVVSYNGISTANANAILGLCDVFGILIKPGI